MLDLTNKTMFFAGYNGATVLFYMEDSEVRSMINDINYGEITEEVRSEVRESIRQSFDKNEHIDKDKHNDVNQLVAFYFISNRVAARAFKDGVRGFAVFIHHIKGEDYNFRQVMGNINDIMRLSQDYRSTYSGIVLTGSQIREED